MASRVIAQYIDELPTPISVYGLSRVRERLREQRNGLSSNYKAPVDYLDRLSAEDIETLINMVEVIDENATAKKTLPESERDGRTLADRPSLKTKQSIEGWRQVLKALTVGADTVKVNVTQINERGEEKHFTQCVGVPESSSDSWDIVFAIGYDSTESVKKTLRKRETRTQFLKQLEGIDVEKLTLSPL